MGVSVQLAQLGLMGLLALLTITFGALAHDTAFAVHMFIFAAAALATVTYMARSFNFVPVERDTTGYLDGVIRAGAIATVFWGVICFLVGVVIALQRSEERRVGKECRL